MGSLDTHPPPTSFSVLTDPLPSDTSMPPFMVSTTRGFLPRADPMTSLPAEFAAVDSLLARMPIVTGTGAPGLLATFGFGAAVLAELPDLTEHVDTYAARLCVVNALYRDYSFLASAYLLEPCHERSVRGEAYGLGRDVLPRQIARPIVKCAEILDFKPFMEYAGSYALYNYRLADPAQGMAYSNLRLIRAFEKGLDPGSSEAGFVLVHVDMVRHSGRLVDGAVRCLDAVGEAVAPSVRGLDAQQQQQQRPAVLTADQRGRVNAALADIVAAMRDVNAAMERMWTKSRPERYAGFRTFIFGVAGQSMFPDGVLYEGVFEPTQSRSSSTTHKEGEEDEAARGTRMSFRGESGANDSMVPLLDNLLQVPMPDTPLTRILADFRSYRPSNHRQFLEWVAGRGRDVGVRDAVLGVSSSSSATSDETLRAPLVAESRRLWLRLLDQVRDFRWRHWRFARAYVLKHSAHPTATGGSPIVTWLPNQLGAVLGEMANVYRGCGDEGGGGRGEDVGEQQRGDGPWWADDDCRAIMKLANEQSDRLKLDVARYCDERGVRD